MKSQKCCNDNCGFSSIIEDDKVWAYCPDCYSDLKIVDVEIIDWQKELIG
ncbi:MAG: hypothetical protein ACM3KI_11080 [Bacillota bacterium]